MGADGRGVGGKSYSRQGNTDTEKRDAKKLGFILLYLLDPFSDPVQDVMKQIGYT